MQESAVVLVGEVALGTDRWVEGAWKLAVAMPWGR